MAASGPGVPSGYTESPTATPEILVVGAGIAALEFVLALRDLAGDRVRVTIVAPERDFVPRPMLVAEPLGLGEPHRRPLSRIASDLGCRLVPAAVASVDPARRRVVLFSGDTLPYDTLVLAPGARTIPAFDGVVALGDAKSAERSSRCATRSGGGSCAASPSSPPRSPAGCCRSTRPR